MVKGAASAKTHDESVRCFCLRQRHHSVQVAPAGAREGGRRPRGPPPEAQTIVWERTPDSLAEKVDVPTNRALMACEPLARVAVVKVAL